MLSSNSNVFILTALDQKRFQPSGESHSNLRKRAFFNMIPTSKRCAYCTIEKEASRFLIVTKRGKKVLSARCRDCLYLVNGERAKQKRRRENERPDLEGEFWKDVKGCLTHEISNMGRLRNKDRRNILKAPCLRGYPRTFLNFEGDKHVVFLHRIVAEVFIPNPENKCCVNHKNGVRHDNRVENLEWVTYGENIQHAFDTGLHKGHRGDRNPNCKLTVDDLNEVVKLRKQGITGVEISKKFKVNSTTIYRILDGKLWRHLKRDEEGFFHE